jgi:hypothetical protein
MKRPRDSQRKKVYRWERAMIQMYGITATLGIDDCQKLVNRICDEFGRTAPQVLDGRGRRSPCYRPVSHTISLPKWSRSRWFVCHELAHSFLNRNACIEVHGKEFVATHIGLLAIYAREEVRSSADALTASAIDSGIKVALQ